MRRDGGQSDIYFFGTNIANNTHHGKSESLNKPETLIILFLYQQVSYKYFRFYRGPLHFKTLTKTRCIWGKNLLSLSFKGGFFFEIQQPTDILEL